MSARSTTEMNTDLNEDKGLASSPDGRDVKLEIISEANANSSVSTSVRGEHQHAKILDSASALRAQGNSKGAFDLSAIEVGEIEFYFYYLVYSPGSIPDVMKSC